MAVLVYISQCQWFRDAKFDFRPEQYILSSYKFIITMTIIEGFECVLVWRSRWYVINPKLKRRNTVHSIGILLNVKRYWIRIANFFSIISLEFEKGTFEADILAIWILISEIVLRGKFGDRIRCTSCMDRGTGRIRTTRSGHALLGKPAEQIRSNESWIKGYCSWRLSHPHKLILRVGLAGIFK